MAHAGRRAMAQEMGRHGRDSATASSNTRSNSWKRRSRLKRVSARCRRPGLLFRAVRRHAENWKAVELHDSCHQGEIDRAALGCKQIRGPSSMLIAHRAPSCQSIKELVLVRNVSLPRGALRRTRRQHRMQSTTQAYLPWDDVPARRDFGLEHSMNELAQEQRRA